MLAIPARLFTKLADLIYAVKRLHQSTNDWRSLVSQCLPLFTVSLKFHLTEAPMSDFLTDFPTDFDVGFLDRFRWQISWAGCHPLEEDWPVKTGDRFEASKPLVEYSWRIIRRQPFPTHATLHTALTLIHSLSFKWWQSLILISSVTWYKDIHTSYTDIVT